MVSGRLKIHSENILPIIKKWLYSDKDIFVRELVANACDAIYKLKVLRENGKATITDDELRIDIEINRDQRTLKFIDTGIGMDAGEVEKYICQLAFSGAEEFLNKYKSNQEGDQIIGHFGLGFYSSYMVAKKVEINTLSHRRAAQPVLWSCEGGGADYQIQKGTRSSRGTEIILYIDKEEEEYLEEKRISQILQHYCVFLPYPIYLNGRHVNHKDPLWIKSPNECKDEDYLDFFRYLYPYAEEPLFWVHLNVDYPFHLKGILYFPQLERNADIRKEGIKLFCNRVFVSDNCKDLIPDYLMPLRGAIESPDIPLNVSRSCLQMDRTVRQLATHISKKVSDSLSSLYRADKERFLKAWRSISVIVKLGAVQDEKFYERVKPILLWKNVDNEWMTLEEYLERNKEKTAGKVFYTAHEKHASPILKLYKEKNIEVLCADSPIDPYLINFLEGKVPDLKFQRIDAGVEETLLDPAREKSVLDAEGKTEAGKLADLIRNKLGEEQLQIEVKSLASDGLPAFIAIDEQSRRLRDYMQLVTTDATLHKNFAKRTLVVNSNSPLIQTIATLDRRDSQLAEDLVREVYDLALLSQRELDPETLNEFISRTQHVLEALAKRTERRG